MHPYTIQLFLTTFLFHINFVANCNKIALFDKNLPSGFNTSNYLTNLGYSLQVHQDIETEDGYLLNIHRIQRPQSNNERKKPCVLFIHALLVGSDAYLIGDQNPALMMADAGYDVWLGNARGTHYSSKHVNLTDAYWDFSWHEIGRNDVPAMINYILNCTKQTDLYYVGHSQGATAFFVMATQRPEMNKFIRLMIGLAPGAFYGIESVAFSDYFIAYATALINSMANSMGIVDKVGYDTFRAFCRSTLFIFGTIDVCTQFSYAIVEQGMHGNNVNSEMISQVLMNTASKRQLWHYLQLYLSSKFKQYNFGVEANLRRYGTADAPEYNLSKVTAPVAIFAGSQDRLVTPANTLRLERHLPNVVFREMLPDYTHLDFLAHKNLNLLGKSIMEVMKRY